MTHEVDGQGNIKIFTFTVKYIDECNRFAEITRNFCDYTEGWNWARNEVEIIGGSIDWNYELVSQYEWESMQDNEF